MSETLSSISKQWRLLDHSTLGLHFPPLDSFAYDDTLCTFVGRDHSLPTIRPWVHNQTIVLGIQDSRLPHIHDGIQHLHSAGYEVIVRNSGGLAVVLDPGILNVSLIMKENQSISIDLGYDMMYRFIQKALSPYKVSIEAREIAGSYCPGSYDLSINGKKFAGISQRRIRGGVAVQIYLCLTGSGGDRARLIRSFYEHAVKQSPTKYTYPDIIPTTMASLSSLLNEEIDVTKGLHLLLEAMLQENISLSTTAFSQEEHAWFLEQQVRLRKRNEKVF
ncbi:biotin/lipoate A/B protein ligase family protein [Halalkalibacter sp. AB-rgal2]|uniref:lipoate--protein ligase family protein n=1 Tax=Halalkalibacter sp. AB-rgal2 TaxID=3242695 RepID=UPI00359D35DB